LFISLLLSSSSALATPYIATAEKPKPKKERRTEVNLAMLVGGTDIGDTMRSTAGVQINVGRRFGDVVLLGEYGHFGVGSSDPHGSMDRLGLTARYSLLRTQGKREPGDKVKPIAGDYWFEGGAGVQRISWDEGGRLTRPELILGFGWQFNAVMDRKSAKPRYYGPYVAFRASLARAPELEESVAAACAGPCDTASGPPGTDVSMFFHFGVNWGR
jgi:hypothetical protein